MVLNRDCLFHLSYSDIRKTFDNFLDSESKFLLSTSHENRENFMNRDIESGDFRSIDLFSFPFNFSDSYLACISDNQERDAPPKNLYLWNREQVSDACTNLKRFLG